MRRHIVRPLKHPEPLQLALHRLRLCAKLNPSFPSRPLYLFSVHMHLHTYAINRGYSYSLCLSQTSLLNWSKYPPRGYKNQAFPASPKNIGTLQTSSHRRRQTNYPLIGRTIIRSLSNPVPRPRSALSTLCRLQNLRSSVNISKTISARALSVILNPLVAPPSSSLRSRTVPYVCVSTTGP